MATLCRAYPSETAARRAVDGLQADCTLITGAGAHDLRREPAGEFAKTVAPDEPVRTFANTTVPRWRPGGGFAGRRDDQREGSFGDADSHVVVRCDAGGHEHTHVAGVHELQALLLGAGLEECDVVDAVSALRDGAAIVLAERISAA